MMFQALAIAAAVLAVRATPAAAGDETPAQLRELVKKSLTGLTQEADRRGHYLFKVRHERKEFESNGQVASRHTHVSEHVEIEGFSFTRTIERDGKPLTADERKTEEAGIQRRLAELKAPTPATAGISALPAAATFGRRGPQDDWYQEFPEALDYKLVGEELLNGRVSLHLAALPRPGYQPRNVRARVFEKLKADMWIDKAAGELVKVDAEIFDTVNVGFGFLGKIEKGTRFRMQRRLLADGDWMVESQSARFGARLLLFKTMHTESVTEWSDYRRRSKSTMAKP
jgi:hypothetical protein